MRKSVPNISMLDVHGGQGVRAGDELKSILFPICFNEGLLAAVGRKYEDAIARLEESVSLMPNRSRPLILMAKIALYQGRLKQCQKYLERASDKTDINPREIKSLRKAIKSSLGRQKRADFLKEKCRDICRYCYKFIKRIFNGLFWLLCKTLSPLLFVGSSIWRLVSSQARRRRDPSPVNMDVATDNEGENVTEDNATTPPLEDDKHEN